MFGQFGINYNNVPEVERRGTILIRQLRKVSAEIIEQNTQVSDDIQEEIKEDTAVFSKSKKKKDE